MSTRYNTNISNSLGRGRQAGRAAAVALLISGLLVTGPAIGAGEANAFSRECASERAWLKSTLSDLLATQGADGNIAFYANDDLFLNYPLIASFGLHIYQFDHDAGFLGDLFNHSTHYMGYLLSHFDADGDFLLERNAWGDAYTQDPAFEDVGFNAMFALDMLSISRIAIELDMPVNALYWYQGMRTVSRQLIDHTYDSNSGFFLPMNNRLQKKESLYFALSALPVYFNEHLGENLAGSIVSNYMLKEPEPQVDSPMRYLQWDSAGSRLSNSPSVDHLMRAILMLGALDRNGHGEDAQRFSQDMGRHIASFPRVDHGTRAENAYVDYLACFIAESGYTSLFPRCHELSLLEALGGLDGALDAGRRARLRSSVSTIRAFLIGGNRPGTGQETISTDTATVEKAVREVYWAVSAMRAKWRKRTLFTPHNRDAIPGFDLYAGFAELLDDVTATLARAETKISRARSRDTGFDITATLVNETAAPRGSANFKFGLSTLAKRVNIASVVVTQGQTSETLVGSPLTLVGGEAPRQYWFRVTLPAGNESTILPIQLVAEVRFADGRRQRYHFRRGVYVTMPVTYAVSFPHGTILKGSSVPIELVVTKHVSKRIVINAEWYSPAGLRLKEGRSLSMIMPADQSSAAMEMHVQVPTPCRPGAFPFLLKLFANGEDQGTLGSNMFKHYQWLFLGPLPAKHDALETSYPPEHNVNLRESFRGPKGPVSWAAIPYTAYSETGEVDLSSLVPDGSMNFLYTVVASPTRKQTVITFAADDPVALFLNGNELARFPEPASDLRRIPIELREGMNNILIKFLAASGSKRLFFQLGEEEDLTSDEYNNNLWELVDGYQELHDRARTSDGESQEIVTLTYTDPGANSVAVIGSFNGWSPVNSTMRRNGGGTWEISLHLTPGRYAYLFLVNNEQQILDPGSAYDEADGYGGKNSVLFVRKR